MALEAPSYEVASTFSSPNNAASAKLPANTTVVVVGRRRVFGYISLVIIVSDSVNLLHNFY